MAVNRGEHSPKLDSGPQTQVQEAHRARLVDRQVILRIGFANGDIPLVLTDEFPLLGLPSLGGNPEGSPVSRRAHESQIRLGFSSTQIHKPGRAGTQAV